MRFNAFNYRLSQAATLRSDWSDFFVRTANNTRNQTLRGIDEHAEVKINLVSKAIWIFMYNIIIYRKIALHLNYPRADPMFAPFTEVRSIMADAHDDLLTFGSISADDVYHHALIGRFRMLLQSFPDCLDVGLVLSSIDMPTETFVPLSALQEMSLFSHGATRLSILRQVLHDLRYPWPGRVASENAPALIKSFWWRPPFGADRITVFVTPDNPTLLDSLSAEFPEPFQTEWGQTLSVSFEPFHSRN